MHALMALTLKKLDGGQFDPIHFPPVVFPKNVFLEGERDSKSLLFVTFKITISYMFPENFIEVPQLIQEM